jgi:hypothetical protein
MITHVRQLLTAAGITAAAATIAITSAMTGVASARVLGTSGVQPQVSPVVWNGTDLVTAAVGANGTLYAYKQVPGAAAWQRQVIETQAQNGGAGLGVPSLAATATSVQVVSEDASGKIWFYQQQDGQTSWSRQRVATVATGAMEGVQAPKIAWTGVPGHTGTNSVITIGDPTGDVLFWYQSGGTWSGETVASPTQGVAWWAPDLTATSTGVVIAAIGTNGAFYSWYQPYGGPTWASDGTLGAAAGQSWGAPALTWDGVNVAAAAAFNDGTGTTLRLAWKPNSAQSWSEQTLPGVTDTQPLVYDPQITYSGFNLVVAAVQRNVPATQQLDFWWEGTTITSFNKEKVATATFPHAFAAAALAASSAPASAEVAIVAPSTANDFDTTGLYDWTQPTGGTGWTKHTINAP